MTNSDVSRMLYEFAEMMDLRGEVFRKNAYSRAAKGVAELDQDIRELAEEGQLQTIPGVGEGISLVINEFIKTGKSDKLEELRNEFPAELTELMRIPDLGPRKIMLLHRELGISTVEELKRAAEQHRVRHIKGFGEKSEANILQGIKMLEKFGHRMLLGDALSLAEAIVAHVRSHDIPLITVAGSIRRMRETIGDVDILVGTDTPERAIDAFISYPFVAEVISRGEGMTIVRMSDGTQADMRIVPPDSYGAALLHFTGSREHNVRLRRIAIQKGLKLNEYGLFDMDDVNLIAGKDETVIYESLGLSFIPPELREDRGEIEAAVSHQLPQLITLSDVRGDLHIHTLMSDGRATMREVAQEARRRGYVYVGLADHSKSLGIASGLSEDDLLASVEQAHHLSEELDFPVLRGAEVDILEDGSLDYSDDVLEQLDFVIASVHLRFKMGRKKMTKRLLTAMSNEYTTILGHPTGRLIGRREGYALDMDKIIEGAKDRRVVLELNGFSDRLDLDDLNSRKAKEQGVMVALASDAHGIEQMENINLAVSTARRGWLEPRDVLNCLTFKELQTFLER